MASFEGSIGIPNGGFNLKVEYSITQSIDGNYSDVSATGYVKRNKSSYHPYNSQSSSNLTIDGSSAGYNGAYNLGSDGYKAIISHSKRIYHNVDGTKSINISFSFDGLLSNWYPKGNISQTITLPTIPRYANITSFSVSQRDETSVQFNWSADAVCDWAWYSTNGGASWNNLDISNVITGLSAGTSYNFKLRVRRTDSQLTSDSGIYTQSTYSYPYVVSSNNFIIGNNININLYNPLGRQCNIYFLGNDNSVICTASRSINGNTSVSNTSEEIDSQYASIPNSNAGTYKIRIVVPSLNNRDTTVNGANYYTNVDDCKPTFNDFTYADVNSTTLALTGNNQNIIPRYSNVKVTIVSANKATAQKYATMNKYSFVCSNSQTNINYNSSEDVEGTINGVKSGVFDVYAIDSRTNSKLVTKIANEVINYTDLIKNSISVSRNNGVSETTTLSIYGKIDLADFGQVVNSIKSAKYRYKATDSQNWSNYTNITLTVDSNGNFSFNGNIQGDTNTGFDIGNSYNIEVVVSDELSSVIFTANLNSGVPNIALHKNGVGIMGKYDVSVGGLFQIEGKDIFKFSSSEFFTGYKWIDGKPIYRKVILFTTSTTLNQWSTYQHNISNIDTILPNWELKIKYLNHWYNTPNDIVIETRVNNTDIGYYIIQGEFAGQQAMVILEYTKTTD